LPASDTDQWRGPIASGPLPRRTRLTISNGEGKPNFRRAINATETTWLTVLPLESHCCAARIGFANPFREPMPIIAAAIHPSASYNPVPGATVPGTSIGLPDGGAPGSPVYFDRAGLDTAWINGAGRARGLIIPGDPGNTHDAPGPFTIVWSDWAPVRSIPRTDGGTQPLLFLYVALDRGAMATAGTGADPFAYAASHACRGRVSVSLSSAASGDWTSNPAATAWHGATPAPAGNGSQWGLSPVFCLQYLSLVPGIQGVISGDSLMSGPGGPHGDGFSAAPIRAAYDLSHLSRPVCMAHLACGGAGSAVYHETLLRNLEALRPSLLVLQPLSRNDGMVPARLDALLARLLMTCDRAEAEYGARTIFQGAYPIPSVDPANGGSADEVALWHQVRATLAAMRNAGMPVDDGAALIGDAAFPWRYAAGFSDDGTHPNDAATETLTPEVRRLLEALLERR
jgi:hypothetical protein